MLDSIFIGTSGLVGFSKALRVVSNNLANVNTPGFKGSQLEFSDFYYQSPATHDNNLSGNNLQGATQLGSGLNTIGTAISFRDGAVQNTGNDLDAAIGGNGFFVLKDSSGKQTYTRAGSFLINSGTLVSRANGFKVQGLDASGKFGDISISNLLTNPPRATTSIKYAGNLASEVTDITNNTTQLVDALGGTHSLSLSFHKNSAGNYTVTVTEGSAAVGTGTIVFNGTGSITTPLVNLSYTPAGGSAISFSLDFTGITATPNTGSPGISTFAFASQDGYATGQLSGLTLDQNGVLKASYTNGQKADGPALALARFDSEADLRQLGGGLFDTVSPDKAHIGRANTLTFGTLTPQSLEGSNVDLAQEFSNLIVMQRGYQASSRVISTANELIQELFDTKGRN
jgi:flagellar hook protein FlgE